MPVSLMCSRLLINCNNSYHFLFHFEVEEIQLAYQKFVRRQKTKVVEKGRHQAWV